MITDPQEDYQRGSVPFLGVEVCLESQPLIPRTETEYWVERAITEMRSRPFNRNVLRIVDLFAGSGCVGLAVLTHIPEAQVTFAEKEIRHFPTIKKSLWKNNIDPRRAVLVQSDVWKSVDGMFDFVLANPPYISRERSTASAEALAFEPHEALYAEDDGFAFIEKTLEGLSLHLVPEGMAWVEHEPFQTSRLKTWAEKNGYKADTQQDQYGVERFTKLRTC